MPKISLRQLPETYAICRLDSADTIPTWADGPGFVSISRTQDELSVVCVVDRVPASIRHDGAWTCFKLLGPFAFDETGIALAVIQPLSETGVGIFLVSTFDTDYLLVKSADAEKASTLLVAAGHAIL